MSNRTESLVRATSTVKCLSCLDSLPRDATVKHACRSGHIGTEHRFLNREYGFFGPCRGGSQPLGVVEDVEDDDEEEELVLDELDDVDELVELDDVLEDELLALDVEAGRVVEVEVVDVGTEGVVELGPGPVVAGGPVVAEVPVGDSEPRVVTKTRIAPSSRINATSPPIIQLRAAPSPSSSTGVSPSASPGGIAVAPATPGERPLSPDTTVASAAGLLGTDGPSASPRSMAWVGSSAGVPEGGVRSLMALLSLPNLQRRRGRVAPTVRPARSD